MFVRYVLKDEEDSLDFSSLPLKHIADLLKINIVRTFSNYYSHEWKEIGLTTLNSFTWFHELTHAIEANVLGITLLSGKDPTEVDSYTKLDREVVANKIAIELCRKHSLPVITPTDYHFKPPKSNDVVRARIEFVREFIKKHEIFNNS
jgi:hypothetical protein